MKIPHQLLEKSYEIALKNLETHPLYNEKKCFLHYSFLIINEDIYTWATNNHITPDRRWGYEKLRRWDDSYIPGTHSELGVIQKCFNFLRYRVEEWGIINIRLNRRGELRLSAPCFVCRGWLQALGCSKIVFTVENGWSEMISL